MDEDYKRYHFSATFKTGDAAVLHCLRALCQWAQRDERSPNIGWGGSGENEWAKATEATVRFTTPERRQQWQDKAQELLNGKWNLVRTDDNNPARRQRPHH
jgi:hypothetical protein